MLFILMLVTAYGKFGIGIGTYPNGLLSLKFCSAPQTVMQLTVGTSTWHYYHDDWSSVLTIGGRFLFGVGEGGQQLQYIHFLGAGVGVHSYNYQGGADVLVVGEGFYEFELFPNPAELPLSLEIGIGLAITSYYRYGMGLYIPLGIHFYFK